MQAGCGDWYSRPPGCLLSPGTLLSTTENHPHPPGLSTHVFTLPRAFAQTGPSPGSDFPINTYLKNVAHSSPLCHGSLLKASLPLFSGRDGTFSQPPSPCCLPPHHTLHCPCLRPHQLEHCKDRGDVWASVSPVPGTELDTAEAQGKVC